MTKKILLILLMFLFGLFLSNPAYSCKPYPNTISIECNPNDIIQESTFPEGIIFHSNNNGLLLYLNRFIDGNINYKGLDFLVMNCKQDVGSIKQEVISISEEYNSEKHERYSNEIILIVPYNETIIAENNNSYNMLGNPDNIDSCYFKKMYKLGDFLVIESGMKDYCVIKDNVFGMCPGAVKIQPKAMLSLLSPQNKFSIKYFLRLFSYIIVLGIIVGFIIYLLKRKEIRLFFKPNKFSITSTIILTTLLLLAYYLLLFYMFLPTWTITSIIPLDIIIYSYLFSSLVKYIYVKVKKK